jgi:hypothetical protein
MNPAFELSRGTEKLFTQGLGVPIRSFEPLNL